MDRRSTLKTGLVFRKSWSARIKLENLLARGTAS